MILVWVATTQSSSWIIRIYSVIAATHVGTSKKHVPYGYISLRSSRTEEGVEMRGVYTAYIDISSISTNKTLMLIQAPSTAVVEILSAHATNLDIETSEQLSIGLYRVSTVGSPSGTSVTPEKHEAGDAAAAATVTGNLTVEPTAYATNPIDKQGVNNLAGYHYDPVPEERPTIAPSGAIGLRLLVAPTSFNCSVMVVYREIG